ncbi:MAG: OmpH family outer membrane protein, partial [Bacteroidota bacterium]
IQTAEVFAAFEMKLEMESRLKNRQQSRKSLLEKMELEFRQLEARQVSRDSIQAYAVHYQQKQEEYAQAELTEAEAYTQQIWAQLNQYLQEYCAQNQLQYLLGANGDGNILGASAEQDFTQEVIQFVNKKYRDG